MERVRRGLRATHRERGVLVRVQHLPRRVDVVKKSRDELLARERRNLRANVDGRRRALEDDRTNARLSLGASNGDERAEAGDTATATAGAHLALG